MRSKNYKASPHLPTVLRSCHQKQEDAQNTEGPSQIPPIPGITFHWSLGTLRVKDHFPIAQTTTWAGQGCHPNCECHLTPITLSIFNKMDNLSIHMPKSKVNTLGYHKWKKYIKKWILVWEDDLLRSPKSTRAASWNFSTTRDFREQVRRLQI